MIRGEHPNPQFRRDSYICLNGKWEFEKGQFDNDFNRTLSNEICVPFCVESELSGIWQKDFCKHCVYAKTLFFSEEDLSERLVLHFGAIDYYAQVYCNGKKVVEHKGGYTPFEADISTFVKVGNNRITVLVEDDVLSDAPSGKQSDKQDSYGCFYTRVTGIWQTVWLEKTPIKYIRNFRFFPNAKKGNIVVELETQGKGNAEIIVTYENKEVGKVFAQVNDRHFFEIQLKEKHLWEIGNGRLYDVEIRFENDKVYSYFGLRDIAFNGKTFTLNGKPLFQRLVLDQGYNPKGLYTAEKDSDFVRDIELAKKLGFNGARLHQKLFEPRFLYYCDKMGFIVWGEYASWGACYYNLDGLTSFLHEWKECIERDFNHPSIVVWCPLNETWMDLKETDKVRDVRFVQAVYAFTKALDDTRPCIDVSGGYHGKFTDIYDIHTYSDPKALKDEIDALYLRGEIIYRNDYILSPWKMFEKTDYDNKLPVMISEYGGVSFCSEGNGWGYISSDSEEDFVNGYIERTKLLLDCPVISGFCYTQLYDIEQEQNGLFTYSREPKLSEVAMKKIADCNKMISAIEKGKNISYFFRQIKKRFF